MIELFLISSCIESKYSNNAFTTSERYYQTIDSIESIKKYNNNAIILLVESSKCKQEYKDTIKSLCNYYLDISNDDDTYKNCIIGHKSLGDAYIIYRGVKYVLDNNINCDIIFKLSGRYTLTTEFNRNLINDNIPTFKNSEHDPWNFLCTCFFGIPKEYYNEFMINIIQTVHYMKRHNNASIECYFPQLFNTKHVVSWDNKIGINGIFGPDKGKILNLW